MTKEEFIKLAKQHLVACSDLNNAPFGFDKVQAELYLQAKAETLQWAIEMLS